MGSSTAYIMTISNSIIGVSVLAMPFCYKQCGIVLSSLLLVLSNILSRSTCHFLLKSAIMSRRRNYELLAFHVFGTMGKTFVELSIIGFMMGTCIAFFVVMGDLGPAILSNIFTHIRIETLRPTVLMGIALFIVLPLGLLRNVESLSAVSTATILFYLCLVLKMLAESSTHLLEGDWLSEVRYWNPDGLLQCLPIFSMALFCQTQLFDIFESTPNLSLDRMTKYIGSAVNMCTAVYMSVGFFGYVAYYKLTNLSGNVLLSFSPNASSEIIKFGFVLSVAVSFPLVIFPCRASIYSFLFRKGHSPHYESVTHNSMVAGSSHIPESRFRCITLFIIFLSLFTALMATNIELVLGLVGATIGVLICVLLPTYIFVTLSEKRTTERLYAKIIFVVGLCIMILGTYANLMASEKVDHVTPQPSMFIIHEDNNKGEIMHLAESMGLSNNFIMQDVDNKIEKPNLETKPPEVNKIRIDYNRKLKEEEQEREKENEKIGIGGNNEMVKNNKENEKTSGNFGNKMVENNKHDEEKKVIVNDVKNKNIQKKKSKVSAIGNIEGARKEDLINNEAIRKDENETQNEITANVAPKVANNELQQNHEIEILEKLKKQEEEQKKIMKQQEAILKEVIKQNRQLEEMKAKDDTLKDDRKNEGNRETRVERIPDLAKKNNLETNPGSGLVSHLIPGKSVSSNLISEKIQELNDNIKKLNRDEIKLTNQIDKVQEKITREEQNVEKVPDGVENQKINRARHDGNRINGVNNDVGVADKPVVGQIIVNKVADPVANFNDNQKVPENDADKTVDKKSRDANGELNNIESPPNEVSKVPHANGNANVHDEAFIEVEKDLNYKKMGEDNSINGMQSADEKKSGAASLANAVPIALMLQPTKKPEPKPDIIKTRDILEDVRREKRDVRQEPANPVPPEYEVMKPPIKQLNNVVESVKLPSENVVESVKPHVENGVKPVDILLENEIEPSERGVDLERRSPDKTLNSIYEPAEMGGKVETQFINEGSEMVEKSEGTEEKEPLQVPVVKTIESLKNLADKPLKSVEEAVNEPLENKIETADDRLKLSKQTEDELLRNVIVDEAKSKTNHLLDSNNKIVVTKNSNESSNRAIISAAENIANPPNVEGIQNKTDVLKKYISNDLNVVNSHTNTPRNTIFKNVPQFLHENSTADGVQNANNHSNEISDANVVHSLDANNQILRDKNVVNNVDNNKSSDAEIENNNKNEKCAAKSSEDIRVPQILSNLDHDDILSSLQLDNRFKNHVINNIAADKT